MIARSAGGLPDFFSEGDYWWPDPKKSDGKPYIRKDGQVNPEREKYDQPTLEAMSMAVENLSLAYFFTGDDTVPGGLGSNEQTVTEELQVHGTALHERLDYQAGAYYEGSFPLGVAGKQ